MWAGVLVTYLCVFNFFYLDHNDFLYVGAAVHEGTLYRDLHYVQAPLGLYVLKGLAAVAPKGWLYVTLRAAALLFGIGAMFSLAFRGIASLRARAVFFLTCLASVSLVRISSEIGSYALALLLLAWGTLLTERSTSRSGREALVLLFGAGLLMGAAGSAKLNHVLLGLVPAVAAWLRPRAERPAAVGVVVLGGILGTAPIWTALAADPAAFLFHNYYFHKHVANPARGIDAVRSATIIAVELARFALVFGPLLGLSCWAWLREARLDRWRMGVPLLSGVLVAILMAVIPGVVFDQYLAPAALLILYGFARMLERTTAVCHRRELLVARVIAVLLLFAVGNHVFILGKRAVREGSPLIQVRAINEALARFHPGDRCDDRLFTLSAAVATDSPFSLSRYTEGGIFWRSMDGFVPLRYREDPAYRFDPYLTKPHLFLAEAGISFLIAGYYLDKGLEDELRSYAESNGFVERPLGRLRKYELTLYARPECLPERGDPGALRGEPG